MNKAVSLVILAVGIVLVVFGVAATESFSSDVSRFFTGSPTDKAIWMQLGGQSYTEIICFETGQNVENFKQGNFRFDAQATAVAIKSGAGANAKFTNGVAVFTMDEAGLMFEASVGGQKFSYQAK